MKEAATFHLEIERFIKAPREKVFAAFTQESLLKAWHCPRGMTVAEASVDARVGGAYRIVMASRDGSRFVVVGAYQAIEPPDFIAYTWRAEGGPASDLTTLIEVSLTAKDGGTALRMRHTGFPNAQASASHRQGWQSCFNRLSDLVDAEGSAGTLTLFGDPRSSYCWTARLGLAEKGVKYRLAPHAPHTPEQRAVHPFGLVPALRDGETEIYETRAILSYVDEAFDGPPLAPTGGVTARARNEQWISLINCYGYDAMVRRCLFQHMAESGPPLVAAIAAKSRAGRPVGEVVAEALREIDMQLDLFEKGYGANDYLTGSSPATADLFLAPLIHYFGQLPQGRELLQKYPAVRHGHDVMKARPSFVATLPQAD
ncbi:MAG TPA: SRPBCC domain-containing protein [Roseiarcus sp.]|nr:SRPBCC domain-containing protein [Roseiarcus sp.]